MNKYGKKSHIWLISPECLDGYISNLVEASRATRARNVEMLGFIGQRSRSPYDQIWSKFSLLADNSSMPGWMNFKLGPNIEDDKGKNF